MLQKTLEQLGFGPKEIEVYIEILEKGKITPKDIAKSTGINRSTVYFIAKELLAKGVIGEDMAGSTVYYTARPPEELNQLVMREKRKIAEKEVAALQAIQELSQLNLSRQYSIPKIRFVEEKDLKNFLYSQHHLWDKSALKIDQTVHAFQDNSFAESYQDWIDYYWSHAPKEMKAEVIANQTPAQKMIVRKKLGRRQTKYWGKASPITGNVWIIGDYVIFSTTSTKPNSLVQIHDPVIAQNMRAIFKNIWDSIK